MADQRTTHVGKSVKDRQDYFRYIKKRDYEPTAIQNVPFSHSNEGGEELKEPTTNRKRPVKFTQKIKDHLSDKWVPWLVTGVILLMGYLMVDSKIDIAKIGTTLETLKENVKLLIEDNKKFSEKLHSQDLKINENSLRLNNFEKQNDNSKKRR